VMRSLTVRVEELEEGPSAVMLNKDRDDRPRRGGPRDGGRDGGRGSRDGGRDRAPEAPKGEGE